jgi:16S rRNA processing protein RimM
MTDERLVVGLVRSARGLRGDVRVEVLTDRPGDRFRPGALVYREGDDRALTVDRAEPVADGPGWWLHFAEVPDRTAADRLRGTYLEATIAETDRPSDGAWWHEVVGTAVTDTTGASLGTVVDVYRAGGAEVFLVEGPGLRIDVPAVGAFVTDFRPREGVIIVERTALGLDEGGPP